MKYTPVIAPECPDEYACQKAVHETCKLFETGEVWTQLSYLGNKSEFGAAFNGLVAVFNIWFASVIFRNENLQVHPMKLFAYIALADALYYSN